MPSRFMGVHSGKPCGECVREGLTLRPPVARLHRQGFTVSAKHFAIVAKHFRSICESEGLGRRVFWLRWVTDHHKTECR